jgi:hypothetical protein
MSHSTLMLWDAAPSRSRAIFVPCLHASMADAIPIATLIMTWEAAHRCRVVGAQPRTSSAGRTALSHSGTRNRMVMVEKMVTEAAGITNPLRPKIARSHSSACCTMIVPSWA